MRNVQARELYLTFPIKEIYLTFNCREIETKKYTKLKLPRTGIIHSHFRMMKRINTMISLHILLELLNCCFSTV